MRLIEITISITTRHLEHERSEFIHTVNSIIQNKVMLTDDEFTHLLELSSIMMKKYAVTDSAFREILDVFAELVAYYKVTKA